MRRRFAAAIRPILVTGLLAGCLLPASGVAEDRVTRWSTTRTEGHEAISVQLDFDDSSPEGVRLQVGRAGFDSGSINIGLTLTNRSAGPVGLNVRGDMLLRDDLGNEYPLQTSRKARERLVEAGGQMIAEFAFLGPLHPEARSLTLEVNGGAEGTTPQAEAPRFSVAGIPVPPEAREAAESLDVPAQARPVKQELAGADPGERLYERHPSGAEIRVRRIAFEDDNIVVGVTARNHSATSLELAGHDDLLLTDDLGNEYRALIVKADPRLVLGPGDILDAELTFLGSLPPEARTLQLLVNRTASASDPETTRQPRMVIRDIPAREWRRAPAQPVERR